MSHAAPTSLAPAGRRLADVLPPLPVLSLVLATAASVVVVSPGVRFAGWHWCVLVAAGVVSLGLAAPAHLAALRSVIAGRPGPHVLASVGVVAAWVWSLLAVATGTGEPQLVAAVVPGALLVTADHLRRRAGVDVGDLTGPRWFGPVALAVALAAGVAWAVGGGPARSEVGLAALLAAAPASLVLAVPLALVTARGRAGRRGVRLGSPEAVEAAGAVDTLVLDADGTVTTGNLRVTSVDPVEPEHDRNLRWFAGALSHAGDHPISRAVSKLSAKGRLTAPELVVGSGMQGSVDRHPVRVGAPDWLGVLAPPSPWRTVAVEVDAKVIGMLTVAEEVRADAAQHVESLRSSGIEVHLVCALPPARAEHVARAVGLEPPSPLTVDDVLPGLGDAGRRVAVAARGAQDDDVSALSIAPGAEHSGGIGVDEPSVGQVAAALSESRRARTSLRRARSVALGSAAVGLALGVAGLLDPDVASLVAAGAAALTASVATR